MCQANLLSNCGWISPSGTFYTCRYYEHDRAIAAFGFVNGDAAMKCGWIKVQDSRLNGFNGQDFFFCKMPSQSQINTIWDWCTAHNKEMPTYLESA